MKTLKIQILSTLMILSSTFFYAQEPSVTKLKNSQNIFDASTLYLELDGDINTEIWNKDYVLIQMEIRAKNVSLEVAKHLISKERFCFKLQALEDGSLVLFMPNFKLPVYINGRRLTEDISYQVYVPQDLKVKFRASMDLFPCPPERESLAEFPKEVDPSASKATNGKEQDNSSL